jgi:hypothetical protein
MTTDFVHTIHHRSKVSCMRLNIYFLNFYLNSRRWFLLYFVYISYLVLLLVSGDRDWIYQLGPSLQWILSKDGDENPVAETSFWTSRKLIIGEFYFYFRFTEKRQQYILQSVEW